MKTLTREQQHAQCMREVRATLVVVAICAVWHIGTAFALNGNGRFLLGMPMWFTVSVLGTAVLGIVGVLLLAKFVFVDFEYDEEVDEADLGAGSDPSEGEGAATAAAGLADAVATSAIATPATATPATAKAGE